MSDYGNTYATPLQIDPNDNDACVKVTIHSSALGDRHEIQTDIIAPLLAFNPVVVMLAESITYLVVRPFEYFPVLVVKPRHGDTEYWTHGCYSGWEKCDPDVEPFAGDKPKLPLSALVHCTLNNLPLN